MSTTAIARQLRGVNVLPDLPEIDSEDAHSPPPANQLTTPPTSPSMRSGPPRSLSFASLPGSPGLPRSFWRRDTIQGYCEDGELSFTHPAGMRGALEYPYDTTSPRDKKGKRRAVTILNDSTHALHESPKEEKPDFDFSVGPKGVDVQTVISRKESEPSDSPGPSESSKQRSSVRRTVSTPHTITTGRAKWRRVRSLLSHISEQRSSVDPAPPSILANSVNITDELIGCGLSTLMLGLWFQRDEKGYRRIPVLMHRLRIRINDSLNPMHIHKSVFRIECEYANGAARWVIYRELRDFLFLHAHYQLSKVYHRNVENLPDFPKPTIPLVFMNKEDAQIGQAEFARRQREALEDYLIRLIRAVMYHPSANRLAKFLELSALFISLAQTGGTQLKADFMKIQSVTSGGGGFGHKSASRRDRGEYRWCAVRDSYIVVVDEPGENTIWDVFLLDSHFEIQRPKRYYRKSLSLLRPAFHKSSSHVNEMPSRHENRSWLKSIPSWLFNTLPCSRPPPAPVDPFRIAFGRSQSLSDVPPYLQTPMLDPSTNIDSSARRVMHPSDNDNDVSKHTFYVVNSQVKLKLHARTERQMMQWITALERAALKCKFASENRFYSFAPVRLNVAAQWLVDGRDYFWNLSRAILLAKECIYIHDWWLSPELLMRRPNKDHYRLDHLLKRKASEGVKIYVILYQEVSSWTTPTNSNYAKQTLSSLHENIMVQRSPSHLQTGTFYWAHHEKLCVIDETIAFMGGLDLCFGRWDTPQHALTDDGHTPNGYIWPGKDYSNPRTRDFYDLHKPFEDMYDRGRTPRMPWHDVGLQVVGQPARDLARHFIQRWNWLLRIKSHTRRMPCLLPPPEFKESELAHMGLTGTLELQICRSAGPWSMGTISHTEQSIQNAYVKAIQKSEHFVYIENQFFITSTIVNDTRIENRIGDALVSRIIRAHGIKTPWKCCIMMPLLPGFTFSVDHADASALRIILDCQNRTLCRGLHSIYSRLRKEGIDPDEYISVFSLRNWGKMRDGTLTTEQVYIHGKVCVVDDRLAIIGSANINERSQRGDRDSEIAAVIRDTEMFDGMMAGKPFKVGRFAHSLRVRLMREHLGIDVDALDEEASVNNDPIMTGDGRMRDPGIEKDTDREGSVTHVGRPVLDSRPGSLMNGSLDSTKQATLTVVEGAPPKTSKVQNADAHTGEKMSDEERRDFNERGEEVNGFASSAVPTLEERIVAGEERDRERNLTCGDGKAPAEGQHRSLADDSHMSTISLEEPHTVRTNSAESEQVGERTSNRFLDPAVGGLGESVSRAHSVIWQDLRKTGSRVWTVPTQRPVVDLSNFEDPIADAFWKDIWTASAVHNTEIYRKVFRTVPDDTVTTWKQYKDFTHHERMNKTKYSSSTEGILQGTGDDNLRESPVSQCSPTSVEIKGAKKSRDAPQSCASSSLSAAHPNTDQKSRRGLEETDVEEMEKLLGEVNGHLVLYPTRFLEGEDLANNFLFNADRLLPLSIYN
ncbi:hypothetical protein AX15_000154 [Amanita polypyramis BW_CC]|nr:hypothetical protein AX15_000154 [Amanita polypyramis BW_CC]